MKADRFITRLLLHLRKKRAHKQHGNYKLKFSRVGENDNIGGDNVFFFLLASFGSSGQFVF
jgi:hypothetical protein